MIGSSLPPVVCLIYVILLCVFTFLVLCCDVWFVFTSSCLSYLRYPIMCLYLLSSVLWCLVRLYLQLFVLFTLYYCVSLRSVFCVVMFGSSLLPVVCLIYVILLYVFTFLVLCCDIRFVFTSSCLSYLRYPIMCLYVPSSVLWCLVRLYFQLFVLFTLSYYVSLPLSSVLWCSVRLYLQLFVLFTLSYYVSSRS